MSKKCFGPKNLIAKNCLVKNIIGKQAWASCVKLRLKSSLKLDWLDLVLDNIITELASC